MDENEFREANYKKFQKHFDHLYRLHQFAEEAMSKYKGKAPTAYETSCWLILARAFKSFDSIRRLCEVALCEDAGVVLRSLLNLLAITRWISVDPQNRSSRYLMWYWVEMQSAAEIFKSSVPSDWIPVIQEHYEKAKALFEYKDAKQRTRMPDQWYQPEANTIRDLFTQVDLEKQYEEGYKPLSGIEHSDATAYFAMIGTMEKGGECKNLEVHSDLFVPHYLRNTFQYFADIFEICNRALAIADAGEFGALVGAGIEFYKADMKAHGIPT